jgi:hypothetical protein
LTHNCIISDQIYQLVNQRFGKIYAFYYFLGVTFTVALNAAKLASYIDLESSSSIDEWSFNNDELHNTYDIINQAARFVDDNMASVERFFGGQYTSLVEPFLKAACCEAYNTQDLVNISNILLNIVGFLFPDFIEIVNRYDRAVELEERLRACPTGKTGWREYQEICLQIISFLLFPPFTRLFDQVHCSDNMDIRDAIIPNDQLSGFWG